MNRRPRGCFGWAAIGLLIGASPLLSSTLTITPTFDGTITTDPNAAAIEGVINSAIQVYENTFSNPITVHITFQECFGSCLGQSLFDVFDTSYLSYSGAIVAGAESADQHAAAGANPVAATNQVNGTDDVLLKCATYHAVFGSAHSGCASDGTVGLNTARTFPGSPGTSSQFYLMAVAEHEIDEILGLGSTLGLDPGGLCGFSTQISCNNVPSPEDLFRYDSLGNRSFTTSTNANAFFSLTGAEDLAQFDNTGTGDYGDWQSNPRPNGVAAQVQDAFATAGAMPALGLEIRALNVVGYDLVAPEPGTMLLMAGALAGFAGRARRRAGRRPRI